MIKSMTGFGRVQKVFDEMSVTLEIRSVNHRFFEFSARVPRAYGFLEEKLKSFFQSSISRGKVDCFVQIENLEDTNVTVSVNHSLAKGYIDAFHEIADRYNLTDDISAEALARYPEIFSIHKNEADEEKVWAFVRETAESALERFSEMRKTEGERLYFDLMQKVNSISECVSFVEERSPQTVKEYNEKLRLKISEILQDKQIDEQRILTEAAIFAEKIAVDEETVRLKSHIRQFKQFIDSDEAIGRKLDFLIQEMNREANTIASKAQDIEIAKKVITIKSDIEKIREQVQNIE